MHSPEVSDKDTIEITHINEPVIVAPIAIDEVKVDSPVIVKEDKS